MNHQLIISILSFILIFLVFKLIYLDKNPFQMTRFWLVQIGVIAIILFNEWKRNIEINLLVPYCLVFVFILILYVIFNRGKNPFIKIDFWILQFLGAIVVMIGIFLFILCALGEKSSSDENLGDYLEAETITSITIIQRKDTVHINEVMPFLVKLEEVEKSSGPVKYPVSGKIIFIRTDGSKDSINTNGYGYGPYKGKWFQSEKNVLEEYFKK